MLAGLLALTACQPARLPPARLLRDCGQPQLSAALDAGRPAEESPGGRCLAEAAAAGSASAAMALADAYGAALATARSGSSAPPLALDLFGRRIAWLHSAAQAGDPDAQRQLAQASDLVPELPMPDMVLAWYQIAAEHGDTAALAAIRAGYRHRRLRDDRLYDLRRWLVRNTARGPAYRDTLRLLGG